METYIQYIVPILVALVGGGGVAAFLNRSRVKAEAVTINVGTELSLRDDLRKEVDRLIERVEKLENERVKVIDENASLHREVAKLKAENEELHRENAKLEQTVSKLAERIEELEKRKG